MRVTNEGLLDIITEASYRLLKEIREAHKNGNLEGYLSSIGMRDLFPSEEMPPLYDTNPEGKILIIGATKVKEHEIYGCLKEYGINKNRIELHLGYEEAKSYPFRRIQYNPNYRLILFGAMPHSGKGKEERSSIIAQIEDTDGYPKVIRLSDGHGLKLTKTGLKNAVKEQIEIGYLAV